MKHHSTGAEFHKFEERPRIAVRLIAPAIRKKDGEKADTDPQQKAGSVIGFECFDLVNEESIIVGSSAAIAEAMTNAKEGTVFGLEFLGKTKNAKGQPVNRFKVDEAENKEDEKAIIAWAQEQDAETE